MFSTASALGVGTGALLRDTARAVGYPLVNLIFVPADRAGTQYDGLRKCTVEHSAPDAAPGQASFPVHCREPDDFRVFLRRSGGGRQHRNAPSSANPLCG